MKKWWSSLSLPNRLQLSIQLVLLALMLVIHFAVLEQYERIVLADAKKEALVSADGVLNGLNMLMGGGAISDPSQRALYAKKMGASEGVLDLRVIRGKSVQDQFGPGLQSEQPVDDMDRRALQTGQLQTEVLQQDGKHALRVVVPFIASQDFRGTNCLTCHRTPEGSAAGAASLTLDLNEEFSLIRQAGYILWAIQIVLQALLYVLVGRLIRIIVESDLQLAKLDRLASTDKLTGAWNRRRLEEAVSSEMDRLRRYDHPLSLSIIDIDFFKAVNDAHGHSVGDQVLARLAAVVQSTLRATDSLTRWGGEEFVVLCPNTPLATETMLAERLRRKIAASDFPTVGKITVSIGAAECLPRETWEDWFQRADAALYRAKDCGRNQVHVAPETPQRHGLVDRVPAHFVQIVWHDAYECGDNVIDDQHRELFGHANSLLAAILSGSPPEEVGGVIEDLVRSVIEHFRTEEAIIAAAGFPGIAEHARIHRELVDRAEKLVERFRDRSLPIGDVFEFLANDVIARHILGADRAFFPYVAAQPAQRSIADIKT